MARFRAGQAVGSGTPSGTPASWAVADFPQRVRWMPARSADASWAAVAAKGAPFTRPSRLLRIAPEESATRRAVSAMVPPLSLRYGLKPPAAPLTLSASACVPAETFREPFSRSPAPLSSFFTPPASSPLPAFASFRPSARSLDPFLAVPTPPLSLSAPLAAFSVASWMPEKEMKIRSRKEREALVDAAVRISLKTVREIWPTM